MLKVRDNKLSAQDGLSILELMATLSLIAILAGIAVSNLRGLENPLANASYQISHYLRLTRSRAISQTTFITVSPYSSSILTAFSADSCDIDPAVDATEDLDDLQLEIDSEVNLTATDWSVCFTPRGLADAHVSFQFEGENSSRTVQVALGGGVKIE